jgi:hypothetical protein
MRVFSAEWSGGTAVVVARNESEARSMVWDKVGATKFIKVVEVSTSFRMMHILDGRK